MTMSSVTARDVSRLSLNFFKWVTLLGLSLALLTGCQKKSATTASPGGGGGMTNDGEIEYEVSGTIAEDEAPLDFVESIASVEIGGVNLSSSTAKFNISAFYLSPLGKKILVYQGTFNGNSFSFKSNVPKHLIVVEALRVRDGGKFAGLLPPPMRSLLAKLRITRTSSIAAKMAGIIADKAASGNAVARSALETNSLSVADVLTAAQSVRRTVDEQQSKGSGSAIDLSALAIKLAEKSNERLSALVAEGQSTEGVAVKISQKTYESVFGENAETTPPGVLAHRTNLDLGTSTAATKDVAYEAIKALGTDSTKIVDEAFRVEATTYREASSVTAAVAAEQTVASQFSGKFDSCKANISTCAAVAYTPPQPSSGGSPGGGTTDGSTTGASTLPVITINTQPSNQNASNGSASFSVSASVSNSATPSYQWQKQESGSGDFIDVGSVVSGEAGSTLTLSSLTNAADNGDVYRVVVSASGGAESVTSSSATLSVEPCAANGWCVGEVKYYLGGQVTPLDISGSGTWNGQTYSGGVLKSIITITSQPSNQTAVHGSASFSVSASVTNGATLSYQWQKQEAGSGSFSNMSGETSSTLTLSGLTNAADNGDVYRAVVSATGGATSVTSSSGVMTVNPAQGDPLWTSVQTLLQFESGSMSDSGPQNRSVAVSSVAQQQSTVVRDGVGALELPDGPNKLQLGGANYSFPTEFTIETWFRTSSVASNVEISLFGDANEEYSGFYLRVQGNGVYVGNANFGLEATNVLLTNTWTHIAFVRDEKTMRLYVNGTQKGQTDARGDEVWVSPTFFGELRSGSAIRYFDNYRISTTCRYRNGDTFTPPESLLVGQGYLGSSVRLAPAAVSGLSGKGGLAASFMSGDGTQASPLIYNRPGFSTDSSGDYFRTYRSFVSDSFNASSVVKTKKDFMTAQSAGRMTITLEGQFLPDPELVSDWLQIKYLKNTTTTSATNSPDGVVYSVNLGLSGGDANIYDSWKNSSRESNTASFNVQQGDKISLLVLEQDNARLFVDKVMISIDESIVPTAPTDLTGTPGDAEVSLSWDTPSGDGGSAISDYLIQYSSANADSWSTFNDGVSTSTNVVVTGLTQGSSYIFRVAAINGTGTGNFSVKTAPITPAPLPIPKDCMGDCYSEGASPQFAQGLGLGAERKGPDGSILILQYANGTNGFKIWKEKNGIRILNATGLIANGWQGQLTRAGTAFSGVDFTTGANIGGRVCPSHVFLSHSDMTASGRCVYYDAGSPAQRLDATGIGGTEASDWLQHYNTVATGRGTSSSYYEGNIKVCADKGMRLPTAYETRMTTSVGTSYLPTGDGISPIWAGEVNGVPSSELGWTWTASAGIWSSRKDIYWLWTGNCGNGGSCGNIDDGYYANDYAVRCVLPSH